MDFRKITYSFLAFLLLSISGLQAQELSDIEAGKVRLKFTQEFEADHLSMTSSSSSTSSARMASINATDLQSVNEQFNITVFTRVFPFSEKHEAKHRKHGLHLWYEVQFSTLQDPREVVEVYKSVSGVSIAKPIYKKVNALGAELTYVTVEDVVAEVASPMASTKFNDPLLPQQWHYESDGSGIALNDADIDTDAAWEVTTGSKEVIIAIVDGGIDVVHEDLEENLWINQAEKDGKIGVDDDGNGYVDDIHGYNFHSNGQVTAVTHGTHVAGTVAAVSNNGKGVAGVAGGDGTEGSGISLMSCQIFAETGASNGAGAAYVYAADNGAIVAQSSWGYTSPGIYEQDVADAIAYFVAEAGNKTDFPESPMVGGLPIFASGNNGMDGEFFPAADGNCFSVNSLGPINQPAPYTNHGTWTDISAPGGDISVGEEGGILSTIPGNKYAYMQGTSMACPHVSGVAGLVLSHYAEEINSPDELRVRIMQGTAPFSTTMHEYYKGKMGVGILNARGALQNDEKIAPDNITDLKADNILHTALDLIWTVPRDEDDEKPEVFYLWIANEEITDDYINNFQPFVVSSQLPAGELARLSITGLRKQMDYYFALQAVDRWGNANDLAYTDATTLDEPHFSFSPKNLSVTIDATKEKVIEEFVTIKNQGESALVWEGYVENNGLKEEEEEEEEVASLNSLFKEGPQVKMLSDGHAHLDFGEVYDINGQMGYASTTEEAVEGYIQVKAFSNAEIKTDTLVDRTKYIAGLQHEFNDYSFDYGFTEPVGNVGFVTATRFVIPADYRLPITHMENMMWVEKDMSEPFIIEVCKGSKYVFGEMEVLHAQAYYPKSENTDVWTWHKVAFSRPIEASGNDVIWIKIYHPKAPLTYQAVDYTPEFPGYNFYLSHDGGRNFYNSADDLPAGGWAINKVRIFSSGEDPAHVYFDPIKGKVEGGTEEDVRLVIDGNSLVNGTHQTAALIYTNDTNYPLGTVAVEIEVKGQEPVAEYELRQSLGVTYVNAENDVNFTIKNSGFANLEITGITSEQPELVYTGADNVVIAPNREGKLSLRITPTVVGTFEGKGLIQTNIGDLEVKFYASVVEPAVAEITPTEITADVKVGKTVEVSFDIQNTGEEILEVEIPLTFEEKHHSSGYVADHENAGEFEDILAFGTSIADRVLNAYSTQVPLDFKFPYFSEEFQYLIVNADGYVYFLANPKPWDAPANLDLTLNEFPSTEALLSSIAVMKNEMTIVDNPLWKIPSDADLVYANLGDRFIVQFDNVKSDLKDEEEGRVTVQLVLFKDGAIEIRFEEIGENSMANESLVGFQNMEGTIGYTIQKKQEGQVVQSNTSYRFVREHGCLFVSDVSDKKFQLYPSESKTITAELDPSMGGLTEGVHRDLVYMKTNTDGGHEKVEIDLVVEGFAELEVNKEEASFEPVMIGLSDTVSFTIENQGTAPFEVSELYGGVSAFTVNHEAPFTVAAGEKKHIVLTYAPTSKEEVSEVWVVKTDVGERPVKVTASSYLSPEPNANLSSSNVNLKTSEIEEGSLEIENTVDSELTYRIFPTSAMTFEKADNEVHTYAYRDSHYDSQVRYEWIEIAEEENRIQIPTDGFLHVELPFKYTFYGEEFDEIWVNENGYITAVEPEVGSDPQYGPYKPNDGVAGVISPMRSIWMRNTAEKLSGSYLRIDEDRIIVEFKDVVASVWGFPGHATFQLILNANGVIKFQYEEVDNFNGEFWYGLKHLNGVDLVDLGREGHEYPDVFDTPFEDYQTIILQPAIDGVLDGKESKTHRYTLSSDRLEEGSYTDEVLITSNSFVTPEITLPIAYNVSGEIAYEIDTDTLDFGNVFFVEGYERAYQESASILNTGTMTWRIEKIDLPDLPEVKLFVDGSEIVFRSNGDLIGELKLDIGEQKEFTLEFTAEEEKFYESEIILYDGQYSHKMTVRANAVLPPVFAYEASDFTASMNMIDTLSHPITVRNTGTTPLTFRAKAGYEFSTNAEKNSIMSSFNMSEEEVNAQTQSSFDSMHYDIAEDAAGSEGSYGTTMPILTAVRMTAPEEGFVLTHVRTMVNYLYNGVLTIQIYDGSSNWPDGGNLLYEHFHDTDAKGSTDDWMLVEFNESVTISGGEDFYILLTHVSQGRANYDNISDDDILARQFYRPSPFFGTEGNNWISGDPENTFKYELQDGSGYDVELIPYTWKIRALSFQANWIELDAIEGIIEAGESQEITTSVIGANLGAGVNIGYVNLSSDDPLSEGGKVNYNVTVNSAPSVVYSPDQYGEPVTVSEGEMKKVNFLVEDPEGDAISFELVNDTSFVSIEQVSEDQARLTLQPMYDHQGEHEVKVRVIDQHGNFITHSISVRVRDINRTPIAQAPWGVNMFLEQPIGYTVNVAEVFEDLDGDALQYGVINDTPDIIDVALGSEDLVVIPKETGVGVVYILADDGRENGFTYTYLVVYVYSEEDLDGTSELSTMSVYPNPAIDEVQLSFETEARGTAQIDIVNLDGTTMRSYEQLLGDQDEQQIDYRIEGLPSGMYMIRISTASELIGVQRIVVQ